MNNRPGRATSNGLPPVKEKWETRAGAPSGCGPEDDWVRETERRVLLGALCLLALIIGVVSLTALVLAWLR